MARRNEVFISYEQLMKNLKDIRFKPQPFIFTTHVEKNGGMLADKLAAHACWYYVKCGHKHLEVVDSGATYEGEQDHEIALKNMAMSIAAFYQVSPEEMLKYLGDCMFEVARIRFPWDPRIEKPLQLALRKMS